MDKEILLRPDARLAFGRKDGTAYLTADGKTYVLSCHPYEPCTYISDGNGILTVIRNAFDPFAVLEAFARGQTVEAITGRRYDLQAFCEMLVFAAERFRDTDIGYVEGAMAVERLKAMGATTEETAVELSRVGVRTISDRFTHSKKRAERVQYTQDGKVYVRIQE